MCVDGENEESNESNKCAIDIFRLQRVGGKKDQKQEIQGRVEGSKKVCFKNMIII